MTEKKDTNPKDAVGIAKVPMSTIPAPVLMEVGLAMMEGARKYGRHNYRTVGVRASVYYDACLRHLTAWWEGEDIDPDSGLSHLVKAIACLVVIRDSMQRGNWVDDRPPSVDAGWQKELNDLAKTIIEKYPDSKEPHTQAEKEGVKGVPPVIWTPVGGITSPEGDHDQGKSAWDKFRREAEATPVPPSTRRFK